MATTRAYVKTRMNANDEPQHNNNYNNGAKELMTTTITEDPSLTSRDTTSITSATSTWLAFSSTGGGSTRTTTTIDAATTTPSSSSMLLLSPYGPYDDDNEQDSVGPNQKIPSSHHIIRAGDGKKEAQKSAADLQQPNVAEPHESASSSSDVTTVDSAGSIYREEEEEDLEETATPGFCTPSIMKQSEVEVVGGTSSTAKAAQDAKCQSLMVADPYLLMVMPVDVETDRSGPSTLEDVSRRLGALWGCEPPPLQEESSSLPSSKARSRKAGSGGATISSLRRGIGSIFGGGGGSTTSSRRTRDSLRDETPQTGPMSTSSTGSPHPQCSSYKKGMLQELDEMVQNLSSPPQEEEETNNDMNNQAKNSMSGMQWRQTFQLPTSSSAALQRVDATSTSSSTSASNKDVPNKAEADTSFGFNVSVNLSEAINSANHQESESWPEISLYDGSTITSLPTKAEGLWARSYYDGSTITSGNHTFLTPHNDARALHGGEVFPYYHHSAQLRPQPELQTPRPSRSTSKVIAINETTNGNKKKSRLSSANNNDDKNNKDEKEKQPLWFVCTVGVLLVLIVFAIVGATACGLGYCNIHHGSPSQPEMVAGEPPESSSSARVGASGNTTLPPSRFRRARSSASTTTETSTSISP